MEFLPANPSPAVRREPPASPARGPRSGASFNSPARGLVGAGAVRPGEMRSTVVTDIVRNILEAIMESLV